MVTPDSINASGLPLARSISTSSSAIFLVRGQVQLGEIDPGTHFSYQRELQRIEAPDQRRKLRVVEGMGARDVAGVAIDSGARVDQERELRIWPLR